MSIRYLTWLTSILAFLSASPPAGAGHRSCDQAASSRVVPAWYATARTAPASPVQLARVLAMVHVAMHDAVNGVHRRYESYASEHRDRSADAEAAAAAAAHAIVTGLFPQSQATWDAALVESLAAVPDGPAEDAGVALGAAAGRMILDVRANDGWNAVDPFAPPAPEPGIWRPTPPAGSPMPEPQFQGVMPFTIDAPDQFVVAAPPSLASRVYRRAFDEVKSTGRDSSTTRTADQTHIAHFWFEPPYDTWSRISGIVAGEKRYDLHETARLYALVNMTVCDSLIAGWYWKRQHAFWRPITAIREANTDGNDRTIADPAWNPLRATPSHPDHPSTHSVCGGAAAEVLRRLAGSDHHRFCMTTLTATPAGSARCLESFSQAQRENGDSRVYAGIHFRTAIEAGDDLGRRIGRFAVAKALRPLRRPPGRFDGDEEPAH